jgi:hypothetical protein
MTEGDYGVAVPYTAVDADMSAEGNKLKFTFKKGKNGPVILEKEYTPSGNRVELEFSSAESALFPAGAYVYSLDWYVHDSFLSCLIENAQLRVGDKA